MTQRCKMMTMMTWMMTRRRLVRILKRLTQKGKWLIKTLRKVPIKGRLRKMQLNRKRSRIGRMLVKDNKKRSKKNQQRRPKIILNLKVRLSRWIPTWISKSCLDSYSVLVWCLVGRNHVELNKWIMHRTLSLKVWLRDSTLMNKEVNFWHHKISKEPSNL